MCIYASWTNHEFTALLWLPQKMSNNSKTKNISLKKKIFRLFWFRQDKENTQHWKYALHDGHQLYGELFRWSSGRVYIHQTNNLWVDVFFLSLKALISDCDVDDRRFHVSMLSGKTLHCHHFDKTGPYTSHLACAGVMAIRPLSKNGTKRKYVFFCHLYSKGHWSTLLLVSVSRSRPANNNIKTHKHCRSYTKLQSSKHTFFVTQ